MSTLHLWVNKSAKCLTILQESKLSSEHGPAKLVPFHQTLLVRIQAVHVVRICYMYVSCSLSSSAGPRSKLNSKYQLINWDFMTAYFQQLTHWVVWYKRTTEIDFFSPWYFYILENIIIKYTYHDKNNDRTIYFFELWLGFTSCYLP